MFVLQSETQSETLASDSETLASDVNIAIRGLKKLLYTVL